MIYCLSFMKLGGDAFERTIKASLINEGRLQDIIYYASYSLRDLTDGCPWFHWEKAIDMKREVLTSRKHTLEI